MMKVPAALDGMRLDRAVSLLTGISRAAASELVGAGRVRVDGATATSRSAPLGAGAALDVDLPDAGDGRPRPDPTVQLTVVHEDPDLVVVDKAAGLVVHPGAGHTTGTLVSGLLARYPEMAVVGDPDRPGIVHRLDRGTSGLLAVARTPHAHRSLTVQLAGRTVGRQYLALVAGHVAEDEGTVDAPVGRSARTRTRMAVSVEGRPARTSYTVVRRVARPLTATLLEVRLDTGRTHQIRVHLSAIGHPVVGDDRYRGPSVPGLDRVFLHAAELCVDHPRTEDRLCWSSPLPAELEAVLAGSVPVQRQAARTN